MAIEVRHHHPEQQLFGSSHTVTPSNHKTSTLSLHRTSCHRLSLSSRDELKSLGTSTHDLVMSQADVFSTRSLPEPETEWRFMDPPDSRYSWLVLMCCIILQLSIGMLAGSVGIFLVEFAKSFPKHETAVSWICTIQQSLICGMGPVAGIMVDKIGARTTIMIGSVGTGLSMAVASFTTNYYVLLFTYGILTGSFACCVLLPTSVCVADHFAKYRVLALTMVTCSLPLIYVAISPLITVAIQMYGWRTANMFIAAAFIQVTVLAALLRPQRLSRKWRISEESADNGSPADPGKLRKYSYSHYSDSHYSLFGEDPEFATKSPLYFQGDISNNDGLHTAKYITEFHEREIFSHPSTETEISLNTLGTNLSDVKDVDNKLSDQHDPQCRDAEVEMEEVLLPVNDANNIILHRQFSSLIKIWKPCCSSLHQHSLFHWRMMVLIAYNFVWGYNSSTFYILLPDLARSVSINSLQIAQLFMVVGATGFSGRCSTVILCRFFPNFGKAKGMLASLGIQSGALFGISVATGFEGFAVIAGAHSFAFGVTTCLATPLILEMHGNGQLPLVYGLELMGYGIGAVISAPFTAFMYGKLGTYAFGFQFAGCLMLVGATALLPHIILKYLNDSKLKEADK